MSQEKHNPLIARLLKALDEKDGELEEWRSGKRKLKPKEKEEEEEETPIEELNGKKKKTESDF